MSLIQMVRKILSVLKTEIVLMKKSKPVFKKNLKGFNACFLVTYIFNIGN